MLLCIAYIHCTGLVQLFTNRLYTGQALCIDTSLTPKPRHRWATSQLVTRSNVTS